MVAGFTSIADAGVVQIDDAYRNLHLVASGQSNTNNASLQPLQDVLSTCSAAACVAYVFSGQYGSFPLLGTFLNGQRRVQFQDSGIATDLVTWYVFDLVNPRSASNAGLEVFGADTALVFSSTDYQLRVLDMFFFNNFVMPSVETDQLIYTNPTGKSVAYVPYAANWYYDGDGQDIEIHSAYLRMSGSQVIANCLYEVMPPWVAGAELRTAALSFGALVVDISNLPMNYRR